MGKGGSKLRPGAGGKVERVSQLPSLNQEQTEGRHITRLGTDHKSQEGEKVFL